VFEFTHVNTAVVAALLWFTCPNAPVSLLIGTMIDISNTPNMELGPLDVPLREADAPDGFWPTGD
jgi:hypothetical protein